MNSKSKPLIYWASSATTGAILGATMYLYFFNIDFFRINIELVTTDLIADRVWIISQPICITKGLKKDFFVRMVLLQLNDLGLIEFGVVY